MERSSKRGMLFCDSRESSRRSVGEVFGGPEAADQLRASVEPPEFLLNLAGRIEPDGGMPGKDHDERTVASLLALLCFVQKDHTREEGAFRGHVRLISFLGHTTSSLAEPKRPVAESILQLVAASSGVSWNWNWADQANDFKRGREPVDVYWWRIERALAKQI